MRPLRTTLPVLAAALVLGACAADDATTSAAAEGGGGSGGRPTVAVTTTTLGDVVQNLAGDQVAVVTIMPVGADPHDFQASAQQVNAIREADALVVNGARFEEGLLDVIESAESDGVPTYEAITGVETLEFGGGGAHGHEGGAEEGGHDGEGDADPHFFQDPSRLAAAAEGIGGFLAETLEGVDVAALEESVDAYVAELSSLDAEIEALLAGIPEERRVLVTNHDAFGYFADRYGFEVAGTVIPSGSTSDGTGAADLADLAELIRDEGVRAIFTESVTSDGLARALASEVGEEVQVVELFTDSLGEGAEGGTYVDVVRTNAQRIADALG